MKNYFRSLFLFLIAVLIVSCSNKKGESDKTLSKTNFAVFELYISGSIVAADNPFLQTKNSNCFEENGLNVNIIARSKGPDIVDALVSGSADFGTLAITPIALQILQGNQFVIFATINTSNHDIKVLGYKSAGIKDGYSLKNKKIGYIGGTYGEIFLDKYLQKYSLKKSQVSLISAGPAQLRDNFINKSLDAIIIWEPYVQDIINDKSIDRKDIFVDVDTTIYTGRINLVAKSDVLASKKDEAKKLVEAIICGEDEMHKNPAQYRELLEKWLGREKGSLKNVFDANSFNVVLDVNTLQKQLQEETEWAKKAVYALKSVNIPASYDKFIDPGILESIAPNRVIK